MELAGTDLLRKAATEWSLSGDQQLLQVLEQMHQNIVTKCQEVNNKLEEMVNTLDIASVDLQNVNNKFMALSNTQFIESRVYDDYDLLTTDNDDKKTTSSTVEPESDLVKMKRALHCLEEMHDTVRILDSDSSDDEDEFRTVLKPKDLYPGRRLPYVIGSSLWRDKWHVGLVVSDSDSDSSAEASGAREQYSDTVSERGGGGGEGGAARAQHVCSSSEPESEPSPAAPSTVSPADVAAQIAKRLVAQRPQSLEVPAHASTEPSSSSDTGPKKVYRPDQPITSTIFFDEPPPLEPAADESSDDDVFAELRKSGSGVGPGERASAGGYQRRNIVDDLFGDQGVFDDDEIKPVVEESTTHKADLTSNGSKRKEHVEATIATLEPEKRAGKKPVGGMSLFGSSQGAESIGAAILKRNQRKSTSSEEEGTCQSRNYHEQKIQSPVINESMAPNTGNIIDELFAIPKLKKNNTMKNTGSKSKDKSEFEPQQQSNRTNTKIDLFSDNIFDDIDDIFTTDVVVKPKGKTQKSIFDDDDDDVLFADAPVKTVPNETKRDKSLFHSDDELFKSDDLSPIHNASVTSGRAEILDTERKANNLGTSVEKNVTSKNSDDTYSQKTPVFKPQDVTTPIIDNIDETSTLLNINKSISEQFPGIEEDVPNKNTKSETHFESTLNIGSVKSKKFESPLLFGEDEIDDLFINNSQRCESLMAVDINNVDTQISKQFDDDNVKKDIKSGTEKEENIYIRKSLKDLDFVTDDNPVNDNLNDIKKDNKNDVVDDKLLKDTTVQRESPFETQITIPTFEQDNLNNEYKSTKSNDTNNTGELPHRDNRDNDIFDDLFMDLPPAFEKPSEPKKSKNVNALFDDDSDDESLFFKKNDATEEKQEVDYNDDRFRIFHDEPPDINVDFSQKSKNFTSDPVNITKSDDGLTNLNKSSPFDENASKSISRPRFEHKEIVHDASESTPINKQLEKNILNDTNNVLNIDTEKDEKLIPEDNKEDEITPELNMKKSVGKLKPINFNINVNTLIPGASPTKQKKVDESDGQTLSYKSNEEINRYPSQRTESKIVKSVSFDGDPQSQVLDNQLSKGRARIQVKRRPSSRRARLEAVRKSGIDYGDDSTDNSSSFDEPKPLLKSEQSINVVENYDDILKTDVINENKQDIKHNIITKDGNRNKDKLQSIDDSGTVNTKTTSKTVYILHDEDIFADSPLTQTDRNKKDLTITNENEPDDYDELFKYLSNKSTKNKEAIQKDVPVENKPETNSSNATNKQAAPAKCGKSIFDEFSDDDELFGGKKGGKKYDDLFSKSISEGGAGLKKKPALRAAAAAPLFDDDSEDDMFRTAAASGVKKTKPIEESSAKSNPAIRDPLSLFADDS